MNREVSLQVPPPRTIFFPRRPGRRLTITIRRPGHVVFFILGCPGRRGNIFFAQLCIEINAKIRRRPREWPAITPRYPGRQIWLKISG